MLKISFLNKKNAVLLISILFLISLFSIISLALGYGSGWNDAETKTNGTYYETLGYYDDYAYYRVDCQSGDFLEISVAYDETINILFITLYNSSQNMVGYYTSDYSVGIRTKHVSESVYSNTHYYMVIERYIPMTGTIDYTLEIEGASGQVGIPGFEVISLLVGVISAISLVYLHMRKKKKIDF